MNYLVFLVVFITITDWAQIWLFLLGLTNPSVRKRKLKDKRLLKTVKEKAGFKLDYIVVIESDKMFGGMSGVSGKPFMMFSEKLLSELNKDEQEYVLLHEAAHFKFHHPIVLVTAQILLISFGLYLAKFSSVMSSGILGIILTLIFVQLARFTERQAENFAAKNMDNPKAMTTAVNKFQMSWSTTRFYVLKKFFGWNISYDEKREIAKNYFNGELT